MKLSILNKIIEQIPHLIKEYAISYDTDPEFYTTSSIKTKRLVIDLGNPRKEYRYYFLFSSETGELLQVSRWCKINNRFLTIKEWK